MLQEYPIQVWYLNLSVLALATVINGVSIAWTKLAPRFFLRGGSMQRDTVTTSRVPAALLTAWRIVAFRWRLPLGDLVDASLFEAFVVCIYMAALLIWEFVHTNNLAPGEHGSRVQLLRVSSSSMHIRLEVRTGAQTYWHPDHPWHSQREHHVVNIELLCSPTA